MDFSGPMIFTVTAVFAFACGISLLLTPAVRQFALRAGLADRPDQHRKLHRGPIALGGGIAVLVATIFALTIVFLVPTPFSPAVWESWREVLVLLIGGGWLVAVGLLDDRRGLRGYHKLLGQLVAASVVMMAGPAVEKISLFHWQIDLGLLAIPFTLFWLLGAINAINLLDGIDGQASLLGIILSSTIAVMAMLTGHPSSAIIAVAFAGSLLGFLRYNFPPASIFLGDAGSMLIGLVVGTLAMRASLKGPGTAILAAPVAILALPILDSGAAILRRKLTGRSIYATDRGHLHHRLLEALGNGRRVLGLVGLCCAVTSIAALLSVLLENDLIAIVACLGVGGSLAVTGIFGRSELLLVACRLRSLTTSLARPSTLTEGAVGITRETTVRLQGNRHWEGLWRSLTESAAQLSLAKICLDVNMPAIHEGYHATWERPISATPESCWQVEVPLVLSLHPVGRLTVQGSCNGLGAAEHIECVMRLVEPVEKHLRRLTDQTPTHACEEFSCDSPYCPARDQSQAGLTPMQVCLCGARPSEFLAISRA